MYSAASLTLRCAAQPSRTIPLPETLQLGSHIAASPSGKLLAVSIRRAAQHFAVSAEEIVLFSPSHHDNSTFEMFESTATVAVNMKQMSFSSDESMLLAVTIMGGLTIWDVSSSSSGADWPVLFHRDDSVSCACISSDQSVLTFIARGEHGRKFVVVSTKNWQVQPEFDFSVTDASLALVPVLNSSRILIIGRPFSLLVGPEEGGAWLQKQFAKPTRPPPDTPYLSAMASCSEGGAQIALVSFNEVRLMSTSDLQNGEILRALKMRVLGRSKQGDPIDAVTFFRKGESNCDFLAAFSNGGLRLWRMMDEKDGPSVILQDFNPFPVLPLPTSSVIDARPLSVSGGGSCFWTVKDEQRRQLLCWNFETISLDDSFRKSADAGLVAWHALHPGTDHQLGPTLRDIHAALFHGKRPPLHASLASLDVAGLITATFDVEERNRPPLSELFAATAEAATALRRSESEKKGHQQPAAARDDDDDGGDENDDAPAPSQKQRQLPPQLENVGTVVVYKEEEDGDDYTAADIIAMSPTEPLFFVAAVSNKAVLFYQCDSFPPKRVGKVKLSSFVNRIFVSRDGKWLLHLPGAEAALEVIDIERRAVLAKVAAGAPIVLGDCSERFAVCGGRKTVTVFNTATWTKERSVQVVAPSSSSEDEKDSPLRMPTSSFRAMKKYFDENETVCCVTTSPTSPSHFLVATSHSGVFELNAETGEFRLLLKIRNASHMLASDADGVLICATGENLLSFPEKVRDIAEESSFELQHMQFVLLSPNLTLVRRFRHDIPVLEMVRLPGLRAAVTTYQGRIQLLDFDVQAGAVNVVPAQGTEDPTLAARALTTTTPDAADAAAGGRRYLGLAYCRQNEFLVVACGPSFQFRLVNRFALDLDYRSSVQQVLLLWSSILPGRQHCLGSNSEEIVHNTFYCQRRPPLHPALPADVKNLLLSAFERDPEKRPPAVSIQRLSWRSLELSSFIARLSHLEQWEEGKGGGGGADDAAALSEHFAELARAATDETPSTVPQSQQGADLRGQEPAAAVSSMPTTGGITGSITSDIGREAANDINFGDDADDDDDVGADVFQLAERRLGIRQQSGEDNNSNHNNDDDNDDDDE